MHAYVLPGDSPGQSVGVFKKLPRRPDGLPALVLLGAERNVAAFTVSNDAQRPASSQAFSLSIGDRAVAQGRSQTRNLELLGAEPSVPGAGGRRLLPPDEACCLAPAEAAQVAAERDAYSFEARGALTAVCYPAALAPYRVIAVRGANTRLSGQYVIRRVTHHLDRWRYLQEFVLIRDARSGGAGGSLDDLAASIF
jgi:hypothetical protein